MKPASYKFGVEWIALNDNPGYLEEELVDYVSVLLLADLFQVSPDRVAKDVIKLRKKAEEETNGR